MLSELFSSLVTSCPASVRNMEYLAETIAMRGRSRRHRSAWQPHLDSSRAFVLSAAEHCRNRDTVVVLGSGLLLDVPVAELSSLFREVILVDIVFLPEVRRQIRSSGNVKLLQHDVTGLAERLYDGVHHGITDLPRSLPMVPESVENAGLVVSLNLLSQLWVIPRSYVLSKLSGIDSDRIDDWCGQIVHAHYDFLNALAGAVCLIADREFVKRDRYGNIVSRGSTVWGLTLPEPADSWTWNIAPRDKENSLSKELIVGAWHLRS